MTRPVVWVVAVLLLVPATMIAYRVLVLDYPLAPAVSERGWQLALEGYVQPSAERVAVRIGYPARRPGRLVIEQEFTASQLSAYTASVSGVGVRQCVSVTETAGDTVRPDPRHRTAAHLSRQRDRDIITVIIIGYLFIVRFLYRQFLVPRGRFPGLFISGRRCVDSETFRSADRPSRVAPKVRTIRKFWDR